MPTGLTSVIIPTFNRRPLLEQAVASVLSQTRTDWELVVVDDGSNDGSAEWIRGLGDARITLVSVSHCGNPARLRNLGLERARGEWIAFLDSDDLWAPRKLEVQLAAMERHHECGWSYTEVVLIDGDGRELPRSGSRAWPAHSGDIVYPLLVHEAAVSCPTVLARRELIASVGGFDDALVFSEDYDLWLRMASRSPALAVSERLTSVRLHPGNNAWGRPEVNRAFIDVYTKFRRTSSDPVVVRLCNQQRAFYGVYYGKQLWRMGAYRRGAAAFLEALWYRPTYARWWSTVLKEVLRAMVPEPIIQWRNKSRRGSQG